MAFDYERSAREAARLSDLIMRYVDEHPQRDGRYASNAVTPLVLPRVDIATADIALAAERFVHTLIISNVLFDDAVFSVRAGTLDIPIDLGLSMLVPFTLRQWEIAETFVLQVLPVQTETVTRGEAIFAFGQELRSFLLTRFEARESDISERPGRLFEVTTNTEGLRVHFSRAFLFDHTQVLGAPTNPVRSWIQPGNYYFGATGPDTPLQFDMGAKYEIPRLGRAHLYI